MLDGLLVMAFKWVWYRVLRLLGVLRSDIPLPKD